MFSRQFAGTAHALPIVQIIEAVVCIYLFVRNLRFISSSGCAAAYICNIIFTLMIRAMPNVLLPSPVGSVMTSREEKTKRSADTLQQVCSQLGRIRDNFPNLPSVTEDKQ